MDVGTKVWSTREGARCMHGPTDSIAGNRGISVMLVNTIP